MTRAQVNDDNIEFIVCLAKLANWPAAEEDRSGGSCHHQWLMFPPSGRGDAGKRKSLANQAAN